MTQTWQLSLQNLWLKTVDFVFQTITLYQILEAGFPDVLGYTYAILIALNALSCVFVVLMHPKISAFGEVLIDTVCVFGCGSCASVVS